MKPYSKTDSNDPLRPASESCGANSCWSSAERSTYSDSFGFTWFRLGIAVAIAGQSMVLSLGYNNALLSGEGPRYGSPAYIAIHVGLLVTALMVMVLLGNPLRSATIRMCREKRLALEGLFSLSLVGALIGSIVSSLSGQGSVYYEVVAVVLVVYTLGNQIGQFNRARATQESRRLRGDFAEAYKVDSSGRHRVPVSSLVTGVDIVNVLPGEAIPVDGRVVEGKAYVEEKALTGEPTPVIRQQDDAVLAGSYCADGELWVLVEATIGNRQIDRILAVVDDARYHPSRWQRQADRIMQFFLPFVVFASFSTFAFWMLWPGAAWWEALFNSMAVLLVACPCALGLATPIALWGGVYRLGQLGLVCRNGTILDTLAECTVVIFDKTGTLSEDQLQVRSHLIAPHWQPRSKWLLNALAGLESGLNHPGARALNGLSQQPLAVESRQLIPGFGVRGRVDGRDLTIGEQSLFDPSQCELLRSAHPIDRFRKLLFASVDNEVVAMFVLDEILREQSETVLLRIQELALSVRIMTGDPHPFILSLANVPIESGLSALTKADRIRDAQQLGEKILFVGDGLNDAAAMSIANGAIAMGGGGALTRSTAQAVLLGESLTPVLNGIRIARIIRQKLRGNLIFAAAYNVIGISLAAAGLLHPVAAALIMAVSSLWVSWRAIHFSSNALTQSDNKRSAIAKSD